MKRSPIKRGNGFRRLTFQEALQVRLAKPQKPRKRLGAGPRMKEWRRVWTWLKPKLEAAGRTRCEFDHLPHGCSGILTPAHSRKRREMQGEEIYEVALACTSAHQILDERLTHERMYVCVNC